jgi:ferric-dicitrate binding protein FerR (iron transport regulator)
MSGDYLWDKSGDPDPEVERLEQALGELRYKERAFEAPAAAPSAPRGASKRGRGALFRAALALAAALSLAGVWAATRGDTAIREAARPVDAFAADWMKAAASLRAGFNVERTAGAPVVGSSRIEGKGRIEPGQWLETDEGSKARIEIADIGRVDVASSTRVRLVATGPGGHRLDLSRGTIHAKVDAPPRLFIVGTPAATAVDLGCAYSLDVGEDGGGVLRVTSGWVALEAPGRASLVPAGAMCRTKPGVGPGTPFFEDAAEALRSALSRLDFEGGGAEALRVVLREARARDSLTLWHLLFRVAEGDRRDVYARLRTIAPPPEGVAEGDALGLDEPKLNLWRDALEATW